ncbi:MAG: hypothetical protein IJO29_09150 [Oscillospiraceae bacterium]|nr:hypothetical protein [Oscillospiraceae bacterium]
MKNNRKIAAITAFIAAFTQLCAPISSNADLTDVADSAWISGDCAVVYPYVNAQTGTIMNGTAEYLTVSDENGVPLSGDIAEVAFNLDNVSTGFQVIDLTFGFDNEKFTYLTYDEDSLYEGVLKRASMNSVTNAKQVYDKGYSFVKIVSSSLNQITDTGSIIKLRFFVPQGTKAGLYPVSVTINDYGYKPDKTEVDLPCVVANSGFISVPGCAESSQAIDFGENSEVLERYIEANLIDTTLDGVEGCSPMDIYWSQYESNPANNSFAIGDVASLELGLRGDANLDGTVDAKDAALIAKYCAYSASGTAPVMSEKNNNLALTLANINGDTASNGTVVTGYHDAKDAASVAKYTSLSSTYPATADPLEVYVNVWTQIGQFGS